MRFRRKILLIMVWVLALSIGVSGTAMIYGSFMAAISREKDSALENYRMLLAAVEVSWNKIERPTMDDVTGALEEFTAGMQLVAVELRQGTQVLRQMGAALPMLHLPEADACVLELYPREQTLGVSGWLDVEGVQTQLTIWVDLSEVYLNRREMLSIFGMVYGIAVSLGGAVSYGLAWFLTHPLERVSQATRNMAQGQLSVRLHPKGGDEVAQLGRDFNQMAQALEANVHQLEETMAAQERFLGAFAHEVKTPMTSVIGYADLLRTQTLTPDEAQIAADYIFSEGRRLESLSMKLLDLLVVRQEKPKWEPVSVDGMILGLVQSLRPIYEKQNITLEAECAPGQWTLDATLITSLLMNLLDNARKAMDGGGVIRVTQDFPEAVCHIQVEDNGRGMPKEALQHLTQAFYRVDKSRSRAQGGAGLGLSLCAQIVEVHGGAMEFTSEPGNGTRVTVLLKEGSI